MDFNGVETYIYKMQEENDISWFPHYRAMILDNAEQQDDTREDV